jgi:hypothetical protein
MARIRNDILLQALDSSAAHGPAAGVNAAGRPLVTVPLKADERGAVMRALAESQTAEVTTDEGTAVKTDAAMLRPEFIATHVELFHGTEIGKVDAGDWHGEAGQVIRIHAADATQPTVVIADGEGLVIEQGKATRAEGDLWIYTTMATATDGPWLIVTTRTLPEHLTEVKFGAQGAKPS